MRHKDLNKLVGLAALRALKSRAELVASDLRLAATEARLDAVRKRPDVDVGDDLVVFQVAENWRAAQPEIERPFKDALALERARRSALELRASTDEGRRLAFETVFNEHAAERRRQIAGKRLEEVIERLASGRRR